MKIIDTQFYKTKNNCISSDVNDLNRACFVNETGLFTVLFTVIITVFILINWNKKGVIFQVNYEAKSI